MLKLTANLNRKIELTVTVCVVFKILPMLHIKFRTWAVQAGAARRYDAGSGSATH
jgi:hypothetical protein